ncbi:MAG: Dps family protein [Thermoanaerobaculia bacterium]|nr:Dps family protein [Thermoanaerobaculia bacterium]
MTKAREVEAMPVNIGLSEEQRSEIAEGLTRMLADTYALYLKTHGFHWNVTGPMFQTLHVLFEEHYQELWAAVDDIAERIRALGFTAPGSFGQFAEKTSVKDVEGVPTADEMIRQLVEGHETVIRTAREVLKPVEKADDQTSADLLAGRMSVHEKAAWMLRSLLPG